MNQSPAQTGQLLSLLEKRTEPPIAWITSLIEGGADIYGTNIKGWNALHLAVLNQHVEVVNLLISMKANLDIAGTTGGNTALHIASEFERPLMVERLVRGGAALNIRNAAGYTPILTAAKNVSASVIETLYEAGADATALMPDGRSLLHLAVDHTMALRAALKTNAPLNHVDDERHQTALHRAVMAKHPERVQMLLEAGAKPSCLHEGHINNDPLHTCISHFDQEIMEMLIDYGADLSARERVQNRTPLQKALGFERADAITLLLQRGAPISPPDVAKYDSIKIYWRQINVRYAHLTQGSTIAVEDLVPADLAYFSNLGKLDELMAPALWRGHGELLATLLSGAPRNLVNTAIAQHPELLQIMNQPQPVISGWGADYDARITTPASELAR